MRLIRFRLLSRFESFITRMLGSTGEGGRSADPFAGVRAPKGKSPSGRNAAVALMEPEESRVGATAVGRWSRR